MNRMFITLAALAVFNNGLNYAEDQPNYQAYKLKNTYEQNMQIYHANLNRYKSSINRYSESVKNYREALKNFYKASRANWQKTLQRAINQDVKAQQQLAEFIAATSGYYFNGENKTLIPAEPIMPQTMPKEPARPMDPQLNAEAMRDPYFRNT